MLNEFEEVRQLDAEDRDRKKFATDCKEKHEIVKALEEAFGELRKKLDTSDKIEDLMDDLVLKYCDEIKIANKRKGLWDMYLVSNNKIEYSSTTEGILGKWDKVK